jgi:hypothetical protein
LRDVGILYSHAVIHKDFPAFLETGLAEKIAFCDHTTHDPNMVGGLDAFLYEAAQNFKVFSKIQDQNKNIKNLIAVDVLF